MRAVMLIGSVIVLLTVSILVIKNMGGDLTGSGAKTDAKQVIERAEDAADQVGDKVRDIKKRIKAAN